MLATFTEDGHYINLKFDSITEMEQISYSFKKKEKGAYFKEKKVRGYKSTVNFLINESKIPVGMWKYLIDECEKFRFELRFPDLDKYFWNIDKEFVEEFCLQLMEKNNKWTPRPYQINAVYKCYKYRRDTAYLSVAAGKTFVIYMLLMLLKFTKKSKKVLIITIKPSLSIQMWNDFREFHCIDAKLKTCIMHEDFKGDREDADIYIGNFQTLVKIEDPTFFEQFETVILDESHRATAGSIKKIITACINAKSRHGFTGSIKEDNTAEYWNIVSYTGPIVARMSKRALIEGGDATDGCVESFRLSCIPKQIRLDLFTQKESIDGEKLLRLEQQVVRDSEERLNWICQLVNKFQNKNVLVFFASVKDGYGKKIVDKLKTITEGKQIFYIDEDVSEAQRKYFKDEMEGSFNNILVATYATFSTGENVKNLHVGLCAEAIKDEILLSQSMGRLMRQHFSKEKFTWIDVVDDLSVEITHEVIGREQQTETWTNYGIKWGRERKKYYDKEEFDFNNHVVSLLK